MNVKQDKLTMPLKKSYEVKQIGYLEENKGFRVVEIVDIEAKVMYLGQNSRYKKVKKIKQ